jgi:hypothetical protein
METTIVKLNKDGTPRKKRKVEERPRQGSLSKPLHRTGLVLDNETNNSLTTYCNEHNIKSSSLIRTLIRDFLQKNLQNS